MWLFPNGFPSGHPMGLEGRGSSSQGPEKFICFDLFLQLLVVCLGAQAEEVFPAN